MNKLPEGFIATKLAEIEREFASAGQLHALLKSQLPQPTHGVIELNDIPVRDGWVLDILYTDMDEDVIFNRFGVKLVKPIVLAFWPTEENPISPEQYYFDGPKLRIVVGPNGVLDEQTKLWLNSSDIYSLLNDIAPLMDVNRLD
jgi:hypothetical protein